MTQRKYGVKRASVLHNFPLQFFKSLPPFYLHVRFSCTVVWFWCLQWSEKLANNAIFQMSGKQAEPVWFLIFALITERSKRGIGIISRIWCCSKKVGKLKILRMKKKFNKEDFQNRVKSAKCWDIIPNVCKQLLKFCAFPFGFGKLSRRKCESWAKLLELNRIFWGAGYKNSFLKKVNIWYTEKGYWVGLFLYQSLIS